MGRASRRLLLCTALGALALACAPAAHAASTTLNYTTGLLSYKADSGEANRVSFDLDPLTQQITIADGGVSVTGVTVIGRINACGIAESNIVCSSLGIRSLKVDLGDADDELASRINLPAKVEGGPGADKIETGAADDKVVGGDGDDELISHGGADSLDAGLGADKLLAGAGPDTLASADGASDEVRCDEGIDSATSDRSDDTRDCEDVVVVPGIDSPTGGASGPDGSADPSTDGSDGSAEPRAGQPLPPAPDIVMPVRPVSFGEPGVLSVKVGCADDATAVCRGDIYIEVPARYFVRRHHGVRAARGQHLARQRRIGHRRFKVDAGKEITRQVRIALRGHYVLRNRRKRIRAKVVVVQRDTADKVLGATSRPVVLERKWARRRANRRR